MMVELFLKVVWLFFFILVWRLCNVKLLFVIREEDVNKVFLELLKELFGDINLLVLFRLFKFEGIKLLV